MSRRQPKLSATALTLTLLLSALPALAQRRPATPPSPPAGASQAADWMSLTWRFLSGLWSAPPARHWTSIAGHEGASLDPDGKPRVATTSVTVTPTLTDEGGSLDPHGSR